MRQLIRTYSITGNHEITVTGYTFTKQDIRLIIDETLASAAITTEDLVASVLVSSTKKGNVVTVQNGVITLANTTAALTVGDELTIEIDIDNVAKEETSLSILTAVNNINVESVDQLAQFFGLPESLLEYQSMTEEEIKSINTDVWVGLYGYEVVQNTLHYKNFIDEVVTIDTYFNSGKTYADYGYTSLWSAHDVTVDVNSNPIADAEIYTYNPPVE